MELEPILIMAIIFGFTYAVIHLLIRRKERMALIEKGENFVQENFKFSQNWLNEIPADITSDQVNQITEVLSMLMQGSKKTNQANQDKQG